MAEIFARGEERMPVRILAAPLIISPRTLIFAWRCGMIGLKARIEGMKRVRRHWTQDDDQRLKRELFAGLPVYEVGKNLGRDSFGI